MIYDKNVKRIRTNSCELIYKVKDIYKQSFFTNNHNDEQNFKNFKKALYNNLQNFTATFDEDS